MRSLKAIRKQNGFTLVELVVVIALMGILVAVAVPQFESTFHKQQLESAADQIVANLNYARAMAIYTSKEYSVVVKASDMSCNVEKDGLPESDKEIKLENLIKDMDTETITYTPRGTVSGGYTITLTGKSDEEIYIKIVAGTGRIRIVE